MLVADMFDRQLHSHGIVQVNMRRLRGSFPFTVLTHFELETTWQYLYDVGRKQNRNWKL